MASQSCEKRQKSTNGHLHDVEVFEQDMEIDDPIRSRDECDQMDSDDGENNMKYHELLQEAMAYGQILTQEYRDEGREYRKPLDEIFSLIAYPDAKSSVYGHLLDPRGRSTVAEELNSAILGKPLLLPRYFPL